MAYLAQGDLEGARRVIADAPPSVEPTALVTFFANYWDLFWVLDDDQQRLLLRLPPGAFDGDRGAWGLARAQTYFVRGDTAMARVYADSARLGFGADPGRQSGRSAAPHPPRPRAGLYGPEGGGDPGRRARPGAAADRPATATPAPICEHLLARIYILAGEPEKALDRLEPLLRTPYYLSPGWLRIDPTFDPLRKHPRFRRLVEGTA